MKDVYRGFFCPAQFALLASMFGLKAECKLPQAVEYFGVLESCKREAVDYPKLQTIGHYLRVQKSGAGREQAGLAGTGNIGVRIQQSPDQRGPGTR